MIIFHLRFKQLAFIAGVVTGKYLYYGDINFTYMGPVSDTFNNTQMGAIEHNLIATVS